MEPEEEEDLECMHFKEAEDEDEHLDLILKCSLFIFNYNKMLRENNL